jgi:hypothetical protein
MNDVENVGGVMVAVVVVVMINVECTDNLKFSVGQLPNLQTVHLKAPVKEVFKSKAHELKIQWQFSDCSGAIDSKHI